MQVGGDAGLEVRVPVTAGPHVVGVSFVREMWEPEGLPQPLQRGRVIANDQVYMDYANVGLGPDRRPVHDRRVLRKTRPAAARFSSCQPTSRRRRQACATKILSRMARLAYRRPVTNADVQTLLEFFDDGPARRRRASTPAFSSRSSACSSIRIFSCGCPPRIRSRSRSRSRQSSSRQSAVGSPAACAYRLSDLEVASRLSFFLWSSIPDERLLDAGRAGPADQSGGPRKGSAAHARRPARHRCAGRQLRRPVAESAPRRRSGGRSGALSELRPEPAAGASSGKPSCSSAAPSAKIAASSIC